MSEVFGSSKSKRNSEKLLNEVGWESNSRICLSLHTWRAFTLHQFQQWGTIGGYKARRVLVDKRRGGSRADQRKAGKHDDGGVPDSIVGSPNSSGMDCFSQEAQGSATGAAPSSPIGKPSSAGFATAPIPGRPCSPVRPSHVLAAGTRTLRDRFFPLYRETDPAQARPGVVLQGAT